jgi:hypothetical protein
VIKAAPPPTWNVFGPLAGTTPFTLGMAFKIIAGKMTALPAGVVPNLFPMWLGIPLIGGLGAFATVGPKLIQKELDGKKVMGGFIGALTALALLGLVTGKLGAVAGGFMIFFGAVSFYFGFVMPQRHIRALDWPRYLVTMSLVVCTMAILLKMCARLTFNVKYVLTIPTISLNI